MIKYLFLSILCVSICYSCVRNESLHEQESLIQPTLPQILNVVPTRVRLGTSRGTHISECGYGNNITLVNTKRFKDLYSPVYRGGGPLEHAGSRVLLEHAGSRPSLLQ